jgi:hypothetical protein
MSKAFTKEVEAGDVYDDLPDRPVSPHNLVTPRGLELIEAELARLHEDHAAAQDADDKALLAKINRDLRYWTSRRATAQVAASPRDAKQVHFGSTVTMLREDGRRQTYRIVGEDRSRDHRYFLTRSFRRKPESSARSAIKKLDTGFRRYDRNSSFSWAWWASRASTAPAS